MGAGMLSTDCCLLLMGYIIEKFNKTSSYFNFFTWRNELEDAAQAVPKIVAMISTP